MVSLTIFNPSGWNIPVAMRRQLSLPFGRSNPSTIHTSPCHVHTAARRLSLKKSNPPKRIQDFHGLLSGSWKVSVAYGPKSSPV